MKNIIKELYYGNIDPQARGFKNGSYLKKQMTIISENEALLTDKLTGDEKKAFLAFANASNIVLGESELDSFLVGFRLGARFAYDLSGSGLERDLLMIPLWTTARRTVTF